MAWQNELSRRVWDMRYRSRSVEGLAERSLEDTWERVADALAATEPVAGREACSRAFRDLMADFKFLPGGRILAGAGAAAEATLANCFVAGPFDDALDTAFTRLRESAVTMQWGGGVGIDFSTVQPRGTRTPGPLAYMRIFDVTCEALSGIGARRGAMMATLRCDHPDIEAFIDAKRVPAELRNFNLSVLVTDDFMAALAAQRDWPLRFPGGESSGGTRAGRARVPRGDRAAVRLVPARALWDKLVAAAYDTAEPGVLFIDRINRANNLRYCETLVATNPCGEIPLPPHGACVLGSMNLPAFVRDAFAAGARFDFAACDAAAATAVRFLDAAVEAAVYPLPEQAEEARATRRIGLGVTGLADALVMLGLRYDHAAGRAMASAILERLRDAAYAASAQLAEEKGSFPRYDRDAYLAGDFVRALPAALRARIARGGIRNAQLLAIAPAGTISVLANNVSSGVEPIFALESDRVVDDGCGGREVHRVADYAYERWRAAHDGAPPAAFVVAEELSPAAHLEMVAALQPFVDGAIAKTINVAPSLPRPELAGVFERAYELGLKGCTVFRPNAVTGAVLTPARPGCCGPAPRSA